MLFRSKTPIRNYTFGIGTILIARPANASKRCLRLTTMRLKSSPQATHCTEEKTLSLSKCNHMFDVPVAFFIYNRAQHTKRVFEAIRTIGPRRLIVVADGPKNVADTAGCNCARRVTEYVDWDCDVRRLYSDVNL